MTKATLSRRDVIVGAAALAVAPKSRVLASPAPTLHEIAIRAFKFDPPHIRVRVGDAIRWTNHDLAPHTATADEFGWDTGELLENQSGEISVIEGMEATYFCAFHPHMKGTIEIV